MMQFCFCGQPRRLLFDAGEVIKAWGFTYKASFIWDKVAHNFGHYNSVRHEFLLVATRGSCLPESNELVDSVVSIRRSREHSQKLEFFRDLIDKLYPSGARLEMFACGRLPRRWKAWGAESK
jgi:N6-adenosine-specific RNA methylase IME4